MASIGLKAAQATDFKRIQSYLQRQCACERLAERRLFDAETLCRDWLDAYRGEAVFAEVEGRPAGFAICLPGAVLPDFPDALYFGGVFVEPEFRCRGVGRAFVLWLFERARAQGRTRIVWCTLTDNVGALAFSVRLGAVARGERSVQVGSGGSYRVRLFELSVPEV